MKNLYKITILLFITSYLTACDDDDNLLLPGSVKVVHAAVDFPPVYINYVGRDITFRNNSILSYRSSRRYTIPTGIDRDIRIVNAEDTLSQLLNQTVNLGAGDIQTLFLAGQGENTEILLVEDDVLVLKDSLVGVRFINLSPDSGPVSIGVAGEDADLARDLAFKDASVFNAVGATIADGVYQFEFKDANDNVIAMTTMDPLPRRNKPLFKNLTFALIGLVNDGQGGSTLSVIQINNF